MQEIQRLFKLLLGKDFYTSHKHKLPVRSFDDLAQDLLPTLEHAHNTVAGDINAIDLYHLHNTLNPMLTTARKNSYMAWLENLKDLEPIAPDVAEQVYKSMWRSQVGYKICDMAMELIDGKSNDLDVVKSYLAKVGDDFIPQDYNDPVDTDPIALFNRINVRGKWVLNIPYLREKVKNLSPGQLVNILARPEAGKTATVVQLIASRGGFADQGARVHLIGNEEGVDATAGRSACCFNEVNYEDAKANPSILLTPDWERVRNNLTFVHQPEMTMGQLEFYIKKNKPDVLVVDQLPHLTMNGEYNGSHERLGAIYRRARELGSIYDCIVIGVNQASVEAEDKTQVTFSMAEGSKTAVAAAADLVIGVGKASNQEEGNEVVRYYTVSKNKISGWRGTVPVRMIQSQSRLTE